MVSVKVWGDYACFSRPEFKVERVSYPIITPSAARGVLEAIYWKPAFRYQIRRIHVLRLGSQTSILRNEIAEKQGTSPFQAEDKRQQRTSLVLKNVAYMIEAEIVLRPFARDEIGGYLDQFNRKVRRGQCHHTPCLGAREFSAFFEPPSDEDRGDLASTALTVDFGQMLFDLAFVEAKCQGEYAMEFWRPEKERSRRVQGFARPLFFRAQVIEGILRVPPEKYDELYRLEESDVA
jgi:CRISPR-associated protein Cas5d